MSKKVAMKVSPKMNSKKEPKKQKSTSLTLAPTKLSASHQQDDGAEVSTHLPVVTSETGIGQQQAPLLTRSAKIGKIASALATAQSEFRTVKKNCSVDFVSTKSGRVYYKYADLAAVVEAIRPTLAKHKLSVSQMPVRCKGGVHITTLLMHNSGQFLQSTLSLEVVSTDIKEVGTIITYGRRYALASILNIVTDEDVDAPQRRNTKLEGRKKTEKKATKASEIKDESLSKACSQFYIAGSQAGFTGKRKNLLKARLKKMFGTDSTKEIGKKHGITKIHELTAMLQKKKLAKPPATKKEKEMVRQSAFDSDDPNETPKAVL